VAVGTGGNSIATSTDGTTWIGRGLTTLTTTGLSVAWNGTRFVAGGQGGNTLAYSYDGATWYGVGSTIFTSTVDKIAGNPKLINIVDSKLVLIDNGLHKPDTVQFITEGYYQPGYNNISINVYKSIL
jgi:hypothetical protein